MTLLELMTAITVLGVLFAFAVPTFRQFTAGSRSTAATNDLITALNLARSEALRRATNVVVCASADQADCSGSGDWATGWIVFADPNGNGDADAGELLQAWPPTGAGLTLEAVNADGDESPRVVYDAMGMGALPGGARVSFSIIPTGCEGIRAGQTDVLLAGTIQSSRVACPE